MKRTGKPAGQPAGQESAEPLARYWQKRDFAATPEPRGEARQTGHQPTRHFYVQRHAARRLHYDFRLELGGVLHSWAVPKGPSLDPTQRRLAVEVEDHPLDYGDFEGVIPPKHYGAGEVLLWDRGLWSSAEADPAAALAQGKLKFQLDGEKLHGAWTLVRMHGPAGEAAADGKHNWLLIKEKDDAACHGEAAEITELAPGSVKPGRPLEGSAAVAAASSTSPLPDFIEPQLATLVDGAPREEGWIYETKYDGYRMLARVEGPGVRLFTRNGKDWTARLPRLTREIAALKLGDSWLDGEIVVLDDDGVPNFQALQNAFEAKRDAGIVYYVFDAPWLAGRELGRQPLLERKQQLAAALGDAGGAIGYSDHFAGSGRQLAAMLDQACQLGLEGLIGKRAGAPYVGGRGRSWIKLKCRPRQEFVIGGYTEPGGTRQGLGALLVGQYDETGALRYAGRVGTGFDQAMLGRLSARLQGLAARDSPFADAPRQPRSHWVRPELVAEIDFTGWTDDSLLRQASFVGLREDKPASGVRREMALSGAAIKGRAAEDEPAAAAAPQVGQSGPPQVAGVAISHPDRLIWPDSGISKLALARYYERVAPWLLPHLRQRPLSLLRCPQGSTGECFFQRHLDEARPAGVDSFMWAGNSGEAREYVYVNNLTGLIGLVQRGVVEFHTWGATLPRPERPDRLTIDLDPAPELSWAQVVEGAMLARTLLDELGLASFVKTTGGNGLHLVVPLQRRHDWPAVKKFAAALAGHLARVVPRRFTASAAKTRRSGRIYVDYLRNDPGATAVAAFSCRARPGAPVSTPLRWDELTPILRAADFNLNSIPDRLAKLRDNPWRDYETQRRMLTKAMWGKLGVG